MCTYCRGIRSYVQWICRSYSTAEIKPKTLIKYGWNCVVGAVWQHCTATRHQFTVDVWVGIIGDLIGHYENPPHLIFNGMITSSAGWCTIGNETDCVFCALFSSCSFSPRFKLISGLLPPSSAKRTKRTSFVAFLMALSHTCRLVPVWDIWGTHFTRKRDGKHAGRALAFDPLCCDNRSTYKPAWKYSLIWWYQAFLEPHCLVTQSY